MIPLTRILAIGFPIVLKAFDQIRPDRPFEVLVGAFQTHRNRPLLKNAEPCAYLKGFAALTPGIAALVGCTTTRCAHCR